MRRSRRLARFAWLAPLAAVSCAQAEKNEPTVREQTAPIDDAARSPVVVHDAVARADGRTIVEIAQDGRMIVGKAEAVPPRSSARLVFEASYVTAEGQDQSLPTGARIQDARFAYAPSTFVALLDDEGTLAVWDTKSGKNQRIDDGVFPGFGFDHAGKTLVYAKGLEPELEAYRVELPAGKPEQLTHGGVPVWGFAFSPDDSRIVYVDAPDGFPCLTVMPARGGERERLTNRTLSPSDVMAGAALAPFPNGRRPPLWLGDTVYVEDARGVHAIGRYGEIVVQRLGGEGLHLSEDGSAAMYSAGSEIRRVKP